MQSSDETYEEEDEGSPRVAAALTLLLLIPLAFLAVRWVVAAWNWVGHDLREFAFPFQVVVTPVVALTAIGGVLLTWRFTYRFFFWLTTPSWRTFWPATPFIVFGMGAITAVSWVWFSV